MVYRESTPRNHAAIAAWYSGNSGVSYKGGKYCADWDEKQFESERCGIKPIGEKQSNPWGLQDMLGNVWEWTQDWYGSSSFNNETDPVGPKTGSLKVVKGGNWANSLDLNRAAARYGYEADYASERVGFRLIK